MARAPWPLALAAAALAAACEAPRACRDATVLVTLNLGEAARQADAIQVDVTVAGQPTKANPFTRTPGPTRDSVEIWFPRGYPEGQEVTFEVTATQGGASVAAGARAWVLPPGCAALDLSL